jgi:two-component system sensor histidine kinase UhpB
MLNLRPSILDQGIVAALEWLSLQFSKTYNVACRFKSNQESVGLTSACCTAMFRICQEALTNVAKHANATQVTIELFATPEAVNLEISDNGAGVTASALKSNERFGIRGMRERAYGLGGWIEVHGSPTSGTTVMLSMPAESDAA